MKIKFQKGNKCDKDKLLILETQGEEVVGIFDLAFYINQIAINELEIIKDKKLGLIHFWFKNVINKAIKDAEDGIDWNNKEDKFFEELTKRPYFIPSKSIDKFIKENNESNEKP